MICNHLSVIMCSRQPWKGQTAVAGVHLATFSHTITCRYSATMCLAVFITMLLFQSL